MAAAKNRSEYKAGREGYLLQKLVEEEDNEAGAEELEDDDEADTGTEVRRLTVHAGHDVHNGLRRCDDHAEHCMQQDTPRTVE